MLVFKYIVKSNVALVAALGYLAALDRRNDGTAILLKMSAFGVFALSDTVVYLREAKRKLLKIEEIKSFKIEH